MSTCAKCAPELLVVPSSPGQDVVDDDNSSFLPLSECNCTENGICNEGVHGDGFCFCFGGWTGESCETPLGNTNNSYVQKLLRYLCLYGCA